MLADPFELVKILPEGLAIVGRAKERPEDEWKLVFLIKEGNEYIDKLKRRTDNYIELRVGYFNLPKVKPILIMIRFDVDMLYDVWLNYHADGGKENFYCLLKQNELIFKFYDRQDCRRTIAIPNRLKNDLAKYVSEIEKASPWSMRDFDMAKEQIYRKFPTGEILWRTLGNSNASI